MQSLLLVLLAINGQIEGPEYGPAKGTLLVIGGGSTKDTGIMETFFRLAGGKNAKLVVVPTAQGNKNPDGSIRTYDAEKIAGFWKSRGWQDVRVLHTHDPKIADSDEFIAPLKDATAVWFDGGRQWNIVDSYMNTKAYREFHKVLERGGIIAGSSAGATIQGDYLLRGAVAGPDIVMTPEKEHERGFNFLKKTAIDQHINTRLRWDDLIPVIKKYPELLGLGLSEGTAILVKGDRFEVMGAWKVAVHDNKRAYQPWEKPYFVLSAGDVYNMKSRQIERYGNGAPGLALNFNAANDDGGELQSVHDLIKAVTFYASFDEEVKGDVGGGQLTPDTRFNHATLKDQHVFEKGFDKNVFRIAKDKGKVGGALEAVDVLPRNGRIFFPAKGNLAYDKSGWGGAVSMWCNMDPAGLKTKFCDPVQITQKGANNGGLWFDFNDAKPRDLRHGAFPAVAPGEKGQSEDDPAAPMVRVPKIGWKSGEWHHVVLTWKNLDTGKADAVTSLYIDGKKLGDVKDRPIAMNWDIDKAGVYVAVNYIGLIDEMALFSRALTEREVGTLQSMPEVLSTRLKKSRE